MDPTQQFPRFSANGTRSRYLEVKDAILDAILRGDFAADGRLPSEEELSRLYGVSRTTVRSALQSLSDEGLLVKRQGSGNYIKSMENILRSANFSLVPLHKGSEPIETESESLVTVASDAVAARLKIPRGSQVVRTFRKQFSGGQAAINIQEFIPLSLFKTIPEPDEKVESINQFVFKHCGIILKEVISEITPVDGRETPFGPREPHILRLEELFLDEALQPVVFSCFFINPRYVRYRVRRKI